MSFGIKPLYDQVFVKKSEDATTSTGIHLPQSVKGRAKTGEVIAVGPGLLSPFTGGYLPMQVKVGDSVFLKEFSGTIINWDGEEVHCLKENEIIGTIPEL